MLSFGMLKTKTPLQKAKDACGGSAGLASKLMELRPDRPITSQAVSQWEKVPSLRVMDVATVTGVSARELRPDMFSGENA